MSYSQALEEQIKTLHSLRAGSVKGQVHELAHWITRRWDWKGVATEGQIGTGIHETLDEGLSGDAFYWSPQMCGLLGTVSKDLPDCTISADLMLSPSGCMWFSDPFPIAKMHNIYGIAWSVRRTQVGVCWLMKKSDGGGAAPALWLPWVLGQSVNETLFNTFHLDESNDRELLEYAFKIWPAAMLFMNQRILVAPKQLVERHTRKRLARGGWAHEPAVRVVQLRRSASQQDRGPGGESVEWSCSWVVRGHWRQQACGPNLSERRPVFVLPHVKGDPEKPLKAPAERVFAVVR